MIRILGRVQGNIYDSIPSSTQRNINFNLDSLELRRKKFDLLTYFKIIHGLCDVSPSEFCGRRPSTTRGPAFKIVVTRARSNCRYHFFTNRASTAFRNLSLQFAMPFTYNSFKSTLNKRLVSWCFHVPKFFFLSFHLQFLVCCWVVWSICRYHLS